MRVIIIGGIAAGMSAAAKLKRMQPEDEVVVYEKTDVVFIWCMWTSLFCWRILR